MTSEAAAPLSATDVGVRFDETEALRGASVQVEAGAMLALLGPSGCGKTTLLRTIAGLEVPDQGEVRLADRVLTAPGVVVPPEQRRIGMVFQDWALFPHMTVAANVAYGVGDHEETRVAEALDMVGLTGLGDRQPATLSGGQQQRVALARALAPRPSVLLLDEPFSNLDTALRVQVRTEVHRLLADLGITTVFVTHDQEEAFVLGDEVAVMTEGRVVQQDTPAALYAAPATRWVATFVGQANLVPGTSTTAGVDTPIGLIEAVDPIEGPVDLLLRPEELRAAPGDSGRVQLVEYYGHDTVYEVVLDEGTRVRVRAGSAPVHIRGDRVTVTYVGPPAIAYSTSKSSP